ncbi:MAG: class I SAM-dependent methyltransferase [Chloroflexi bacterium]|nr:class I SAM-dependent methyltransferase [Chloroflexota bacterium]
MYHLEDTHWWYVGMRGLVETLLDGVYRGRRDLSVLDAGCGTGGMLPYLAKYGKATGVDYSGDALSFCQGRGLSRLVRGSVSNLPFESSSFDLVVSFDVLYHLAVADDEAALQEFYRVLTPDGHLLIRLPAYDWLRGSHDRAVHTRHRYTASEVRHKMRRVGFRVERATYANSFLLPVAVLKRISEMVFKRFGSSDVKPTGPFLNRLFRGILGSEASVLRRADLPWGLSVMALGEKNGMGVG